MAWFKSYSGDISDPKIDELLERFGSQGYFFREHLMKLLAANFNISSPGFCVFRQAFFFNNFIGKKKIKYKKTCIELLDFLSSKGELKYELNGDFIEIDSYEMEKRGDAYTKETLRRLDTEREREK